MFVEKAPGQSIREFFTEEMEGRYPDGSVGRVLDCAVVNMTEAYIAYERAWPDGKREVSAIVCLLAFRPRDEFNFGYKDMGEEMHPYYYNCPERILKMLTPTDNKSALEWRRKCWENLRARQARPKLRKGMVIRFDEPIRFRNGAVESEFRVEDPRRLLFTGKGGWGWYRLRRWLLEEKAWSVLNEAGAS
ncbi:MAG: hypothetical protein QME87_09820 [Bacillota bacterium]|nr:hypothetical protein [Bacillota bacterium]